MRSVSSEKYICDILILGGGPAGLMAAVFAAQKSNRVALLEKNPILGKKLRLTGNGRCNLTQALFLKSTFMARLGRNGRFLFPAISAFGPRETMNFFEKSGLPLITESSGKVFPKSEKAQEVVDFFQKILKEKKVKIFTEYKVKKIEIKNRRIEFIQTASGKIYAKNFILAVGGASYPKTGSVGDGYSWLEEMGHHIVRPTPALSPIKIQADWISNLQGLSFKKITLQLFQNQKKIGVVSGDLLFTHFGLSGPAALDASRIIQAPARTRLEIDFLPQINFIQLEEKFKNDFRKMEKISLKKYLSKIVPQKMALQIARLIGAEPQKKLGQIKKSERMSLIEKLKRLDLQVENLLGFSQAMVTRGGVSLKEVDSKTMRSKLVSNLYFAGEILDLDGPTGGYNLQIAWTTGRTAGLKASENIDKN